VVWELDMKKKGQRGIVGRKLPHKDCRRKQDLRERGRLLLVGPSSRKERGGDLSASYRKGNLKGNTIPRENKETPSRSAKFFNLPLQGKKKDVFRGAVIYRATSVENKKAS